MNDEEDVQENKKMQNGLKKIKKEKKSEAHKEN